VLNPLEDVFSVRIHPLDHRDHMLSKNLLVDISVERLSAETRDWRPKSAKPALILPGSLLSAPLP
jgi:hypothetical protein